jgi:Phospholipase_D-nuclease N-terminal
MGRLIPLLFLIEVALVAVALISCLSAEDEEIRTLPRVGWIFVILLVPLVGAVAWFSAGRPVPVGDGVRIRGLGGGYRPGSRAARGDWPRPHRRVVAPDDDPDFLRSLDVEQAKRDHELFRRWEDDLRRGDDPRTRDEGRPRRSDERRREPGGTSQDDTPQ